MKIKKRSASLLCCAAVRLHWCWLSASALTPSLWFCFMVCVEAEDQNNSPANVKSKDLHAGKRVIYSWPLDSPFQMLDHVKQTINITCAGAFMGPHPLPLVCIPEPPQCCNQSCRMDACSLQAADNVCGKGLINIQQTRPPCLCGGVYPCS